MVKESNTYSVVPSPHTRRRLPLQDQLSKQLHHSLACVRVCVCVCVCVCLCVCVCVCVCMCVCVSDVE
jgi:hypothetical protein